MKIEDADLTAYGIDRIAEKGLLREALDLALKAIQEGQDDGDLYFVAASLAYRLGDLDKAAQMINRLLSRDPEHLHGWILFGRIFAAQNDLVRAAYGRSQAEILFPALSEVDIARDLSGEPVSASPGKGRSSLSKEEIDFETVTFAEICIEQGYLNKALKIYNDLLARNPENIEIQMKVAELKKRLDGHD